MRLPALVAVMMLGAGTALAQPASTPTITLGPDSTLLNVTAEGRSRRQPDVANFSAGVVTHAATAGEALTANARKMEATVAALKRAGIPDRDIQTSNLSLQPQYSQPPPPPQRYRTATGEVVMTPAEEQQPPRIIGYETRNTVSVRLRRITEIGRIIDTLVGAGANQVDGPHFSLDEPEAAGNEARVEAMNNARTRAELYARAAGMRVGRILTITEGGGYYPVAREIFVTGRAASMGAPPPPPPPSPVQPGEVLIGITLSVQFALER